LTGVLIVHNCWARNQPTSTYLVKIEEFVKESGETCRILGPHDFINHGLPMSLNILLQGLTLRSKDHVLWFMDNGTTDLRSFFHRFKRPRIYDYSPGPWLLTPYGRELAWVANYVITHSKRSLAQLGVAPDVPGWVMPQSYGLDLSPTGKRKPENPRSLTGVIFVSPDAKEIDFALACIRRISKLLQFRLIAVAQNEAVVPYLDGLRCFWRLSGKVTIVTLPYDDPDYSSKRRSILTDCDFHISAAENDGYSEFLQSQLYEIPSLVAANGYCSEFAGTSTLQFEPANGESFIRALRQLIENIEDHTLAARSDRIALVHRVGHWESELKEFVHQVCLQPTQLTSPENQELARDPGHRPPPGGMSALRCLRPDS
jgi:hypothetical protein